MTSNLLNTIIANTYTTDDLNTRLALLREFFEEQFFAQGAKQLQEFFAKREVGRKHQKAMLSWNREFYNIFNQENLYQNLEQLSDESNKLPRIALETALDLSDDPSEQGKLAHWFRQNIHPQILLQLKTDRQIIGGVKLVHGSNYADYSLRTKLKANRQRLRKLFSEGLRCENQKSEL